MASHNQKMARHNQILTLAKRRNFSSMLSTLLYVWSILWQYAPSNIHDSIFSYVQHLYDRLSPYIHVYIDEYSREHLVRNDSFSYIQAYLGENGSRDAKRLRMSTPVEGKRVFSIDEQEEVSDNFDGVKVWWALDRQPPLSKHGLILQSYKLTFHRKHKDLVTGRYLDHVIDEGKKIKERCRTRKLYMNSLKASTHDLPKWTCVTFDHPATFESLAMEPGKKREIVEDLLKFSQSKDYYARIGKAWKRGYLLYGPPGTGKSTLVSAMANLLEYDVYDLELTAVKDNTELKKLLISTKGRSIIVVEDIDCSVNLSLKRDAKANEKATDDHNSSKKNDSDLTLSGLLNSIDGIWSACGGERIMVFTTNYVKKLDKALIRTGRMDKHIELSYCCFEGFKVLAKNYLSIEEHPKFDVIKALLEETNITPADVAENLIPKSPDEDAETCLDNLICCLEKKKEKAAKKKERKRNDESTDSESSEDSTDDEEQIEVTEKVRDAEEEVKEASVENKEVIQQNGDVTID